MKTGTIVLWEKIDRITKGTDPENKKHRDLFYEQLDGLKNHLAMVFHRYLENSKILKIELNGNEIKPWDPFLRNHPSTQRLPQEYVVYNKKKITIRPFILPHRSKLDDKSYEQAGGTGGWNERQGFYVYRNQRLIVPGDWLGLGIRKEQHTKLARILVDIPNSLDGDWKIDVKKSVARPPALVKDEFRRIAKLTVDEATAIYTYRGKPSERNENPLSFPWSTIKKNGTYHYSVNRNHPLISDILQNSGAARVKIEAFIRLIEETVPVPLIILNSSNNPDKIEKPFEGVPSDEMRLVLDQIWDSMIKTGVSKEDAGSRLRNMEPFSDYPNYVAEFLEIKKRET